MRTRLSLLLLLPMFLVSTVARGQVTGGADGAAAVVSSHEAVQQVVAKYAHAIETEDVELFRSVMPGLNDRSEKRLRKAFDAVKVQEIGLTIQSVEIDGATATVRASRRDVVDGQRMKPIEQEFHLARQDAGWTIRSLSVR